MSKKVVILGGVGNGTAIANAIKSANMLGQNELECVGFLNDRTPIGDMIEEYPVLGMIHDAGKFVKEGFYFINTILRIDGQEERLHLFDELGIPDEQLATFIHPLAYVAPNVVFGAGSVVMPLACVSPSTIFGKGCIVMVAATVGHNNHIGDFCHIAAQACVGSYLQIGEGVHIGLNATIREELVIERCAAIGMGSVLTKNVGEKEIWVGNPAKFLRKAK